MGILPTLICPTTFHLLDTHPYMKSLHNPNEIPPDMIPTFINSETYQTASTVTSARSGSGDSNDVLYIKLSIAVAGLNKS